MSAELMLGLVILCSHFLEGITGFGCTVLALPFAIMLIGTKQAVPVLMALALMLALFIVVVGRKKIVWKEYLKIVGFAALGLPLGVMTFDYVDERSLKYVLGIFMVVVALRGLLISLGRLDERRLPKWLLNITLVAGGFIHGAFSSGGPLVVMYARKALPDKGNFRATISLLWVTLNTLVLTQSAIAGKLTPPIWHTIMVCAPFFALGAIAGNWAHHRIRDQHFSRIVSCVLLVSGAAMFR